MNYLPRQKPQPPCRRSYGVVSFLLAPFLLLWRALKFALTVFAVMQWLTPTGIKIALALGAGVLVDREQQQRKQYNRRLKGRN